MAVWGIHFHLASKYSKQEDLYGGALMWSDLYIVGQSQHQLTSGVPESVLMVS